VNQRTQDVLEHDPVGDAAPVIPVRMDQIDLGAGGQ
jgi:hypothetical protein